MAQRRRRRDGAEGGKVRRAQSKTRREWERKKKDIKKTRGSLSNTLKLKY